MTFRAEHKRLRGLLRAEGLDPYRPAGRFVSVGERYRRSKQPRMNVARLMAAAFERTLDRQREDLDRALWPTMLKEL